MGAGGNALYNIRLVAFAVTYEIISIDASMIMISNLLVRIINIHDFLSSHENTETI